jgi:hypothetical protein
MAANGFIRNADYREIFNVDRPKALRALSTMVASGVLRQEGVRRGTRYRSGSRWPDWLEEDKRPKSASTYAAICDTMTKNTLIANNSTYAIRQQIARQSRRLRRLALAVVRFL